MSNVNPNSELSRERIRLMLMMRRMVREEFGVTVLLSEDQAVEELLAFAARARNTLLRQMARELEGLQEQPVPEPAPATTTTLCYRGAATAAKNTTAPTKPSNVQRIYRGQVVG